MYRKWIFVGIISLFLLTYSLSWKNFLESRLKNELVARGMAQLEFNIESVGFQEIIFRDITYGDFKLPILSIKYKPAELLFNKEKASVDIGESKILWNDGVLSTPNISVPLYSDAPISFTLKVQQVSLNSLLSAATSNRASATGVVSGALPVVINRDGTFTVKKGDLRAEKAGTLKISPDVIPSDAQQVALLRDVLKDFHYSSFSMGIESADSKQLAMLLSLEGNNPDVYNGRSVKLNVHLTGDVIEMITQSLNILK